MKFTELLENLRFDKRLTDWNMKHGVLQKNELEKHLTTLEDSAANVQKIHLDSSSSDPDSTH